MLCTPTVDEAKSQRAAAQRSMVREAASLISKTTINCRPAGQPTAVCVHCRPARRQQVQQCRHNPQGHAVDSRNPDDQSRSFPLPGKMPSEQSSKKHASRRHDYPDRPKLVALNCCTADLDVRETNATSHRGRADTLSWLRLEAGWVRDWVVDTRSGR